MTDFETAIEAVQHLRSDVAREVREEGFRRQDERIEKRAEQTKEENAQPGDILTAIIASGDPAYAERIQRLSLRADLHQSAVVEALLENREALDAIELHLEILLGNAYVLPEGRRVFKSEDGERVFDEHGSRVSADEIDPDMIDDRHPSWETFQETLEAKRELSEQRTELVAYQNRLDQAQSLIDQGGLSEDDFAELDNLMTNDVPDAVRSRLPSSDPAYRAGPDASSDGASFLNDQFGFDIGMMIKGR